VKGQQWARLLPLALLIVLGLAGLRGVVGTLRWDGPLHRDGLAAGLALEAVFAVLTVLTLRRHRSAHQDLVARKLRATLFTALGAGAATVAEVLHASRPWHTAVLGAALIAYLLATHLAESGSLPVVLRPHTRVLAAGAVLLALGAGAGMLPAAAPGAGSALLRLVAAGALIAAAGLVLPYVTRGEDQG